MADEKHEGRPEDRVEIKAEVDHAHAATHPTTAPTTPPPASSPADHKATEPSSVPTVATVEAPATASPPVTAPAAPLATTPPVPAVTNSAGDPLGYNPAGFAPSPAGSHIECPDCRATNNVSKKHHAMLSALLAAFERRCHECGRWLGLYAS